MLRASLSMYAALHALGMMCQVVVNEACSKNLDLITDAFGATPDWVELYNTGTEAVDLTGYHLSDEPTQPWKWALPSIMLEPGAHLVVFHGNDNSDGLHFPFNLDRDGEPLALSSVAQGVIDVVYLPFLKPNHSTGKGPTGSLVIFDQPTPGAANNSTGYQGYAQAPAFSIAPGFHNGPTSVAISSCSECLVHLTWDGREPDASSAPYTGPITLEQTAVVKAIAYRPGHLPSTVTAGTYLINANTRLPVVSISVHPDSLFDDTLGLYELGPEAEPEYPHWGANFWDERGIDVRFEYFDEAGVERIDQDVELRIHGGRVSRNQPQRPLRLTARDRFGDDHMDHTFFPEKPFADSFKRLVLRNSGSDWCQAHYRDGFWHQVALHAGLDIDVLGFKSSVVYLNGAYWGILNIRERVDVDYLALNHGVDPEPILLMDEEDHIIQGDSLHFDSLQWFIRGHDMADDAHFALVDSLIDLTSFMDYFALEVFAGNSDWPSNNLKFWKPAIHEGKWRYLMYDLDATLDAAPWIPVDFDMFYWLHVHREGFIHAEIYQSLIQRPEFRRTFLNRLADLMNTCLAPASLRAENEHIRNTIEQEIPRHFARWGTDVATWHQHSGEKLPAWMDERGGHVRNDVLEWYDLPNTAQLRFDVFPPEAGTLQVNTLIPALPFEGIYFNGNDIDVSVSPAPGFTLSHWTYSAEPTVQAGSEHLRRSFAQDGSVTAHFTKEGTTLYAFPNPAAEACDLSYEAPRAGLAEVSLYDAQGRLLAEWKVQVLGGVNRIPVDLTGYTAGVLMVHVKQDGARTTARVLRS
ncbi:MAG: CotH kinase family protein [Flavobacteriales bacterium]|nr:CotH kinase family protein [Flavobacteriales bacterium]